MAVHLNFLLILTGLTGIRTITTVSKVSVKARDSISIPCLYDSKYKGYVKYLCQGYYWNHCSYAVKTNQPSSGKFLISDDKTQNIFTVTIKDLTDQDTDYWCAVEINGGSDVREYFHLSVTGDTPSLYVDHQEIAAFKRDNITINCYHHNSGEMKWCRLGSSCVTGSSGSIDETKVTINTSISNVFTVTMSGLKTESSGWYQCVKGDLQMPVHINVTAQPTTTDKAPTTAEGQEHRSDDCAFACNYITGLFKQVCYIYEFALYALNVFYRVKVDLKSLLILLSLLIFAVMVTLFIWFMLKRCKKTREEASATTSTEAEVTYSTVKKKKKTSGQAEEEVTCSTVKKKKKTSGQAEEDVTYSNVKHVTKTSGGMSDAEKTDVDVMYSSVVTVERNTVPRVETKAEDVTYSTVA